MQERKVRRLPVIDEQSRLVGIVSLGDLAHCMHSQQTMGADGMTWIGVAYTLASVSEPRQFTPPPSGWPHTPSGPPVYVPVMRGARAG